MPKSLDKAKSLFATVIAVNDTTGTVNGFTGGIAIPNVLTNDTYDGNPATLSQVTLSLTSPFGNPNITLNTSNGIVNVAEGTPEGTYTGAYTICDILDPMNCASALMVVQVTAPSIVAIDNSAIINGFTGGVAIPNILTNDTLGGVTPTLSQVTISVIGGGFNTPNVVLDTSTGTVTVAPATPANTYFGLYQICEILNPSNCSSAGMTVIVTAAAIVANNDSGNVNGMTGGTAIPNILSNDTLNGAPVDISQVNLTLPVGFTSPNISLNLLTGEVVVAPNTATGVYSATYSICEKLNPSSSCATADINVTVTGSTPNASLTIQNNASGIESTFSYLSNIPDTNAFTLSSGSQRVFNNLAAGTYTIEQFSSPE